ncbi:MAG: ABC transporter permease [Chryseolinea sp.]
MFRNYLLIGIRNLTKHRFYSLINVAGLAIGLAAALLLFTWIFHEVSYDKFHARGKLIYRACMEYSFGGQSSRTAVSPTALLPALQKSFPEVENGVRVYDPTAYNPVIVRRNDKVFQERRFYFADSTFFQIFTFPILHGDSAHALTLPYSVVLTKTTAKRYFGTNDPLGKTIQLNNDKDYIVTGIIDDVPSNSILQFDFVASFSSVAASRELTWGSANYETFVVLNANTDVAALTEKTQDMVQKAFGDEFVQPGDYVKYNFIPLQDIYLRSDMTELRPVSSIQYIYIFGGIAVLVLLIACINYVNLATARGAVRAKEVGIRKVVGAARRQLFIQFISESLLITALALIFALIITKLSIPLFNMLVGKNFADALIFSPDSIVIILMVSLFVALIAGCYPAIAMTSFKPVLILKGNFKTSGKGIWLRQSLVVFQFAISVILIVGTLVVSKQLDFIQNKRLGYDRENIVVIPLDSKTEGVYKQLKTEVMRTGDVVHVARATESPTVIAGGYSIQIEGGTNTAGMVVTAMSIDEEFIPALGMELVVGRNFNDADQLRAEQDTTYSFILNESALHELYLTNDKAIGTSVSLGGRRGKIVGVVKDFHFAPLQSKITPLVFFNQQSDYNYIFITLKPGNPVTAISRIGQILKILTPHRPFDYTFLDEEYNTLYDNEQRMGKIITTFAVLTVFVACLGLLGLVSFFATQKTKEIGIRKVLGATPTNIVILITKDFTRLVLVAILIGLPLAYWLMSQWLNEFVYRTDVGIMPLVAASALCIAIAFGTASYQAMRAAFLDPARTLRSE